MSYYVVKPPRPARIAGRFVMAAVGALLGLSLLAGWAAARPITVIVDGETRHVRPWTTVADLHESGALRAPDGRLLDVHGEVVEEEGGQPARVKRNGSPAAPSHRLIAGDVIASARGADVREPVVVTDVPLPFETEYQGAGPLVEMASLGAPGLMRVTRGALTGIEVTSTVVQEPSPMVIARSRPTGKVVALTFDDGPWPGQTEKVLKVLEREQVRATFFMLGRLAERNPKLAKRIVEEGHDVGNHTYSHKSLSRLSGGKIKREVSHGRTAVEKASGGEARWLRPPYGAMDSAAWEQVRDMDVRTVLWDVDSRDWTRPGAKKIVKSVTRDVKPGSVVLFHDGGGERGQTTSALGPIIRKLKREGYSFVTVQELWDINAEAAQRKRDAKKAIEKRKETAKASGTSG